MLEVCVDTIQAAMLAERSGADRIELCSALDLGGVTPSEVLLSAVRRFIHVPLIVLIRSRAGDFIFDSLDRELMLAQAVQATELGATGIAIGGLTRTQGLDLKLLESIASALPKSDLVMHRAFDHVLDPGAALERLVELGFTRILTSGGPRLAVDGLAALRELSEQAKSRIEILPAGGISPSNAMQILRETSSSQLHGSFRNASVPFAAAIAETKAILRGERS